MPPLTREFSCSKNRSRQIKTGCPILRKSVYIKFQISNLFSTNGCSREDTNSPFCYHFRFLNLQNKSASMQFYSCFKWIKKHWSVFKCIICILNNTWNYSIFIAFLSSDNSFGRYYKKNQLKKCVRACVFIQRNWTLKEIKTLYQSLCYMYIS